jgi:hypothetical protein
LAQPKREQAPVAQGHKKQGFCHPHKPCWTELSRQQSCKKYNQTLLSLPKKYQYTNILQPY